MEMNTDVQAQETPATDVVEQIETLTTTGEGAIPAVEGAVVPPVNEYKPNFEFTIVDQKKEFDERLKQIIKSKEDEDYVRDLVTRAEGLEINKKNMMKFQEEATQFKTQYSEIQKDVDVVLQMADNQDVASIQKALKLSDDAVLQRAIEIAKLRELTPAQRDEYNKHHRARSESYQLKTQNELLQSQLEEIKAQQRKTEFTNILNQSEHAAIIADFDKRNGQNAFWNEVARLGYFYETQMNVRKDPNEVINELITRFGLKPQEMPKTPASLEKKPLPVIPNTGAGGGAAPVMRKPKTLADLKNYAKTLED